MADRIYGINRNEQMTSVVEGSASPTKDVEIVVDLAVGLTKAETIMLIEQIKNKIVEGIWPPA